MLDLGQRVSTVADFSPHIDRLENWQERAMECRLQRRKSDVSVHISGSGILFRECLHSDAFPVNCFELNHAIQKNSTKVVFSKWRTLPTSDTDSVRHLGKTLAEFAEPSTAHQA